MSKKYDILKPKHDLVFKLIFGSADSVVILKGFLKAVLKLEEEVIEITVVDPYFRIDTIDDKVGILDIKLELKNGEKINIEIQVKNMPEMPQRIVYYTSKMITEQLKAGRKYNSIKKVISIIILDYNMIKDSKDYHNSYLFRDEKNNSTLTDILQIHTLELRKIPKDINSKELEWLKFISSESEEEMDMLAKKNPEIKEAFLKLKELSQDEITRLRLEAVEKRRLDDESRLRGARKEGKQEGKQEGEREAISGIVINLYELGNEIEYISRATKTSIKKIEEIIKNKDLR